MISPKTLGIIGVAVSLTGWLGISKHHPGPESSSSNSADSRLQPTRQRLRPVIGEDKRVLETGTFALTALTDPDAALALIAGLETPEERDEALARLALDLTRHEPATALRLAWEGNLGSSENGSAIPTLERLADRWAEADFDAALTWAKELPTVEHDGRRDVIIGRLAIAQAGTDPRAAALMVSEIMADGRGQSATAIAVLKIWAEREPSEAFAWASLFSEDGWRETAMRALTENP